MPWKETTPLSERLLLCKLAVEGVCSISQLARDFGISRKTANKWIARYQQEGETGLLDQSRRPDHSPQALSEETVAAIVALRQQYPFWGAHKLQKLLAKRLGDAAPSQSSVQRILERKGLIEGRPPVVRPETGGRFQRGRPNALWQMDFTSPFTLPTGQKVYPLPVLDDCSRFCLSLRLCPACSTEMALAGFREAATFFGLPEQVLTDHGGCFGTSRKYVSAFTAYLWALEVEHIQGRVAHPQTQGKTERFNRTLQAECLSRHTYSELVDWNRCVEEYRNLYNTLRPHEALSDATPAAHYQPSERPFVEPDRHFCPHEVGFVHRRVDSSGKIWLLSHHVLVSAGLAGWRVSARHDGDGLWTILFRGHTLCQAHLAKEALYKPRP